jgi:hypothetical protein
MVRLGWICIAVGLMMSGCIAFKFFLNYTVDPAANDPVAGFLMALGLGTGITIGVIGGVIVAKSHGIWTPPI